MKKENRSCGDIQKMIILEKINPLADSDKKRMLEHIEICPKCAAYGETLNLMVWGENHESISTQPDLNAMREKLTMQIRLKGTNHSDAWITAWIRQKLTQRVPLYQAAIAFVLLFIITVTTLRGTGPSLQRQGDLSGITGLTALDTVQIEQLNNIGRSSLEDSTLTRLTVTSL